MLSKNVKFNGGERHFQKSRKNKFVNAVTASKSGTFQLVLKWIWKGTNLKRLGMDKGREGQVVMAWVSESS